MASAMMRREPSNPLGRQIYHWNALDNYFVQTQRALVPVSGRWLRYNTYQPGRSEWIFCTPAPSDTSSIPSPTSAQSSQSEIGMLNVKKLSDLLARNVHQQLYPRMFIMSPNGTLLAYSTPANIKELRDQAALVSMAWKDQEAIMKSKQQKASTSSTSSSRSSISAGHLETLTIEFESNNLIVRALQPNLLLVLVGNVPPGRKKDFKMTPESPSDARYPPAEPQELSKTSADPAQPESSPRLDSVAGSGKTASPSHSSTSKAWSELSNFEQDKKMGVLHIQRKKLDAMARFIREDFERKGFVMPDDASFP